MDLTKLSKKELLVICEEGFGIKCKSKKKNELIELINKNSKEKSLNRILFKQYFPYEENYYDSEQIHLFLMEIIQKNIPDKNEMEKKVIYLFLRDLIIFILCDDDEDIDEKYGINREEFIKLVNSTDKNLIKMIYE
jgi:hypothetical protein